MSQEPFYWTIPRLFLERRQGELRQSGIRRSTKQLYETEFNMGPQRREKGTPPNSVTIDISNTIRAHVQKACKNAKKALKDTKKALKYADYLAAKEKLEDLSALVNRAKRFSVDQAMYVLIHAAHLPRAQLTQNRTSREPSDGWKLLLFTLGCLVPSCNSHEYWHHDARESLVLEDELDLLVPLLLEDLIERPSRLDDLIANRTLGRRLKSWRSMRVVPLGYIREDEVGRWIFKVGPDQGAQS